MCEVENQAHYPVSIMQLKLIGQFLSRTIFAIVRTGESWLCIIYICFKMYLIS